MSRRTLMAGLLAAAMVPAAMTIAASKASAADFNGAPPPGPQSGAPYEHYNDGPDVGVDGDYDYDRYAGRNDDEVDNSDPRLFDHNRGPNDPRYSPVPYDRFSRDDRYDGRDERYDGKPDHYSGREDRYSGRDDRYDDRGGPPPPPNYPRSLKDGDYGQAAPPPRIPERRFVGREECVPRKAIKFRLASEGWSDFDRFEPAGPFVRFTARRPSGALYDLTLDRCTGEITHAKMQAGPAWGRYATRYPRRIYRD